MAKLCEACGLDHEGARGPGSNPAPSVCEAALWQRVRAGLACSEDRVKALRSMLEHLYGHIGPERAKRAHESRRLVIG